MTSYFQQIPGLIKYIAIIDRDVKLNNKELTCNPSQYEWQRKRTRLPIIHIFITRPTWKQRTYIIHNKEQKLSKNIQDEYIGFLMPFYEFEYDLGIYAFVGNNGIKILTLKKLENNIQETSSEIKLRQVNIFLI